MERDFSVCRAEGSSVFIRRIQERARVIDIIEKIRRVAAVTLQGWGCKAEVTLGLALDKKKQKHKGHGTDAGNGTSIEASSKGFNICSAAKHRHPAPSNVGRDGIEG